MAGFHLFEILENPASPLLSPSPSTLSLGINCTGGGGKMNFRWVTPLLVYWMSTTKIKFPFLLILPFCWN